MNMYMTSPEIAVFLYGTLIGLLLNQSTITSAASYPFLSGGKKTGLWRCTAKAFAMDKDWSSLET